MRLAGCAITITANANIHGIQAMTMTCSTCTDLVVVAPQNTATRPAQVEAVRDMFSRRARKTSPMPRIATWTAANRFRAWLGSSRYEIHRKGESVPVWGLPRWGTPPKIRSSINGKRASTKASLLTIQLGVA